MRIQVLILALALALLLVDANAANSATVAANLSVTCPFNVTMHTLPEYPIEGNVLANYTIFTQARCDIDNLQGFFNITTSSGHLLYSAPQILAAVTNSPLTVSLSMNTLQFGSGNFIAAVAFKIPTFSNSSTSRFELLYPANISLSGFSSQQSVLVNSPIDFSMELSNMGFYSSNTITIHLLINGPQNYNESYNALPLAAYPSSENVSLQLSNVTSIQGQYTATAYATYLVGNSLEMTSNSIISYSVIPSTSSISTSPPPSTKQLITAIPQLELTTAPLYTYTPINISLISLLGIKNIGSAPESVNISVPSAYSGLFIPSAKNLYILPNQSISDQILFNAVNGTPGTYIIPVNFTTASGTSRVHQTEYFSLTLYNRRVDQPSMSQQLTLVNYTKSINGIVGIYASPNANVTNTTFITTIPLGIAQNISQITAYGLPNIVSEQNGFYTIRWLVNSLPANQVVYAYYTIRNPGSQNLIEHIQSLFINVPPPPQSSIFRIVNINLPTFYTNSLNTIDVYGVYTGTVAQQIAFSISAPSGITVLNSTQTVNATPNQLLDQKFKVPTGSQTGTLLFTLRVYTNGYNSTISLPILVLQKPQSTTSILTNSTITLSKLSPLQKVVLAGSIVLLCILVLLLFLLRNRHKSKYNPERAQQLIRLREQMKRNSK